MKAAHWLPSRWGALILLLAMLAAGMFLPGLRLDTRLERMVLDEDDVIRLYDDFKAAYGRDEFVLIALSGRDLFSFESLDAMAAAMAQLEETEYVGRVSGIPQIFMELYGGEDAEALRDEITETPFYKGFFISEDESMAGLVVEAGDLSRKGANKQFVAEVKRAAQMLEGSGFDVDLIGAMVIGEEIRRLSMAESVRFFPIAMIISLIILLLLLRSFRAAAIVLICALITIILTLESVALSEKPLNVVTVSFPLILWMLTLANGLHLVTRYQHLLATCPDRIRAVKAALREVAFPCFLSAITTAFGFLSLSLSEVRPIREFGQIMAAGMVFAFIVNVVIGSWLLVLFRTRSPRWLPASNGSRFQAIGAWTLDHAWKVIIVFCVLIVIGVFSLTRVRSERNTLSFLPEDAPAISAFHRVSGKLTGMYTMEILVDTPDSWLNTGYWEDIETLRETIIGLGDVARVVSPLDYLRKLRQWDQGPGPEAYRLPDSQGEAEELVAMAGAEGGLRRFVREDGRQIRMTALLTTADAGDFVRIHDSINEALSLLPEPLSGYVTGRATQMQRMQVTLIESQRNSFSVAFLLVFASMLIGLRSIRLLLLSIVPNLMPILSTFTVMVLLDIPLDAGTVMVASIALGIAVDDTVHILAGYDRRRRKGEPVRNAILLALRDVGPSITVTSFTASAGFFILSTSVFAPLSYFGLASGIAILIAFLADLFFVPAILAVSGGGRDTGGGADETAS
jgi:uncharacterized protein